MRQRSLAMSTRARKVVFSGIVENQYLVGSASPSGHSISNHSSGPLSVSGSSRSATRTRNRANREDSFVFVPSRHVILRQDRFGKAWATSLTETTRGLPSPRRRLADSLRVDQASAGMVSAPGGLTVMVEGMPAT